MFGFEAFVSYFPFQINLVHFASNISRLYMFTLRQHQSVCMCTHSTVYIAGNKNEDAFLQMLYFLVHYC